MEHISPTYRTPLKKHLTYTMYQKYLKRPFHGKLFPPNDVVRACLTICTNLEISLKKNKFQFNCRNKRMNSQCVQNDTYSISTKDFLLRKNPSHVDRQPLCHYAFTREISLVQLTQIYFLFISDSIPSLPNLIPSTFF